MSIFHIKIIAITTMVIDHIGAFFIPEVYALRMIGRLSFLLFAWLIANGAYHTKNIFLYLRRLLLLGVISQIPFMLIHRLHSPNSWEINIFLILFLGLLSIYVIRETRSIWFKVAIITILTLVAERFGGGFSYGAYGVVSILGFYIFRQKFGITVFFQAAIIAIFYVSRLLLSYDSISQSYENNSIFLIQPLALLSLIFIYFHNSQQGKKMQWFFYWFYPAHLTIIYLMLR